MILIGGRNPLLIPNKRAKSSSPYPKGPSGDLSDGLSYVHGGWLPLQPDHVFAAGTYADPLNWGTDAFLNKANVLLGFIRQAVEVADTA